jgi:hypothetical protein
MYLLPCLRDVVLPLLPQNGVVAEIGVAEGHFSRTIFKTANPRLLHLIDPWEHQQRADYQNDPNNVQAEQNEARYQQVSAAFKAEVERQQVVINRAYSTQAVHRFVDASFDWIYIDGLHTYEGVKADLEAFAPKVKADGFILGHDYTNHPAAQQMGFGVMQAVNEFVGRTDFQFVALTNEAYPTYVLCRSPQVIQQFCVQLILQIRWIVEIRDFSNTPLAHSLVTSQGKGLVYEDGHFMHLPTFG